MKIDLVGGKNRGLAMGLNEFSGYVALALSALGTGWLAARYGLRPEPFVPGIVFVTIGLALSAILFRDTTDHVSHESALRGDASTEDRVDAARGVLAHDADRSRSVQRQPGRSGQ
jgi:MFS family permease